MSWRTDRRRAWSRLVPELDACVLSGPPPRPEAQLHARRGLFAIDRLDPAIRVLALGTALGESDTELVGRLRAALGLSVDAYALRYRRYRLRAALPAC
jgi:hypothetical protein